jgi:hypothetical protein
MAAVQWASAVTPTSSSEPTTPWSTSTPGRVIATHASAMAALKT